MVILVFFACSTHKNVKKAPEFRVVEAKLAKGIKDVDNRDVLLTPTTSFTTRDNAVIAHIRLANVAGNHKVKWQWYRPVGSLYYESDSHKIVTAKGKYAKEVTLWHKISIKNESAQQFIGMWTVKILYDGGTIVSKRFDIAMDKRDMVYDVDADIPATAMKNPDGIAVVIGNRTYKHQDMPPVEYAHNDAESVKKYLIKTLGYREENIFLEKDITKARFEALFGISGNHRGILYDYIKPSQSDVFIYYSGHGLADLEDMQGYFVPVDSDPAKIAFNGYALALFYENLSKLETRRITIILDACFSGGTNSGEFLIKSASPALIRVNTDNIVQSNTAVLTSSDADQISSWYDEQGHGLFSYFFLKGLGGAADLNQDSQITFQEIYDYVSDRSEGVPYWARRLHGGREQTPMLYGNRHGDILVKF